MSDSNKTEIEALAHLIWERQGRPENKSQEHWLEAEYHILQKSLVHETSEAQIDNDVYSRGLGPLSE
jgi:hypothetical protein